MKIFIPLIFVLAACGNSATTETEYSFDELKANESLRNSVLAMEKCTKVYGATSLHLKPEVCSLAEQAEFSISVDASRKATAERAEWARKKRAESFNQ